MPETKLPSHYQCGCETVPCETLRGWDAIKASCPEHGDAPDWDQLFDDEAEDDA